MQNCIEIICPKCGAHVTATLIPGTEAISFGRQCARYKIARHKAKRPPDHCNGDESFLSFEKNSAEVAK
jgi:hypothetical protein